MSVVVDAPRTVPVPPADLDPAIAAAKAAGRLAGERLAAVPLTSRQRATIASVMGGAR